MHRVSHYSIGLILMSGATMAQSVDIETLRQKGIARAEELLNQQPVEKAQVRPLSSLETTARQQRMNVLKEEIHKRLSGGKPPADTQALMDQYRTEADKLPYTPPDTSWVNKTALPADMLPAMPKGRNWK